MDDYVEMDSEDFLDMLKELEEQFGVEIPEAVIEQLATPRRIIDFFLERLVLATLPYCLTQRSFYRIRHVLGVEAGCARGDVRPRMILDTLIPLPERRATWERLRVVLRASTWPALVRPGWLVMLLIMVTEVIWATAWASTRNLLLAIVVAGVAGTVGMLATRPMRWKFPQECTTTADLARFLVANDARLVMADPRQWTRERVEIATRYQIARYLRRSDFSDDTRLIFV